ncbi:hypothetical protein E4U55_003901 [Claviceps digitariae]|nr:hypothetical protein E4U55_003901 [Claviceps digitariae]
MAPLESFRTSCPRRWCQSPAPKTPEPPREDQAQHQAQHQEQQQVQLQQQFRPKSPPSPPSPPARLRFRLRRRTTTQRNAPTTQFLASVAAADVPLPSIEEPQVYDDDDMLSIAYPTIPRLDRCDHVHLANQPGRGRTYSPPKTPAPELAPSLSLTQFPDWSLDGALSSLESSPEYESSRPSTARSTQTSSSLFSQYSFASEDLSQCASPESDHNERFGHFLAPEDADKTIKPATARSATSAKSRRAPWTSPMSQHLWSTYMTYLQDPKVTPFRVGKSGIPPSGVCVRVAREAKRSWKGSRPQEKPGNKSGSSTPTAESAGPYIEWPHTCASTRARLRELCKAHSATSARQFQYPSNSPTPFGKTAGRFCARRSVPARSPSVFSASDLAMSLSVSTADSMQIQGPLAQLTSSQTEPFPPFQWQPLQPLSAAEQLGFPPLGGSGPGARSGSGVGGDDLQQSWPPRLGSPFMARSYGPSSSSALKDINEGSGMPRRQSHSVGTRRGLRSPVRFDPQSRSSLQKRRSRQSILEPRRTKRPSLGSDFWIDPSVNEDAECNAHQKLGEFSSTDSKQRDNLFVPRTNLQELFEASNPTTPGGLTGSASFPTMTALASSCQTVPARLGSPFSVTRKMSHSFPNRRSRAVSSSPLDVAAAIRPFATVHPQSGETPNNDGTKLSTSASNSAKTPLMDRLAYIDERLKTFRRRDKNGRRSDSPA